MAKGLDRHKGRMETLASFGKNLARRSGSKCELCGTGNVSLAAYEVPPVEDEPDFDHCVFTCEVCRGEMVKLKNHDTNYWQCLNEAVWSGVPAVKVLSVKILKRFKDEAWVHELLEQVYLEPEEEDWVNS